MVGEGGRELSQGLAMLAATKGWGLQQHSAMQHACTNAAMLCTNSRMALAAAYLF